MWGAWDLSKVPNHIKCLLNLCQSSDRFVLDVLLFGWDEIVTLGLFQMRFNMINVELVVITVFEPLFF